MLDLYYKHVKRSFIALAPVPGLVTTNLVNGVLAVSNLLVDAVAEGLVLRRPLRVLLVDPGVDGGDVGLASVVLGVGEVLQVGDLLLASVVLRLGEVVQVGDLALARVVLRLGPPRRSGINKNSLMPKGPD